MRSIEDIGPSLPAIARRAIEAWAAGARRERPETSELPAAPVFVTLRTKDGRLRGCIGTLRATEPNVVFETARSAVLAASQDPRFAPVAPAEIAELRVEVSVLLPEEAVSGLAELDPQRYGVIVRDEGYRHGVLLPNVEGVDDAETQVSIARRKAGIPEQAPVRLSRFRVMKYHG
jgi:AmmeMemoRadiSam system protein A